MFSLCLLCVVFLVASAVTWSRVQRCRTVCVSGLGTSTQGDLGWIWAVALGRKIMYVYTGLFKMIVGVLTSCHTQYT